MGNMRINKESGFIVGVAYNLHFGFDFGNQLRIQTDQGVRVAPPGLDDPKRAATVMDDFRKLRESGVNAVTIKLFTDGRTGIDFDPKDPGRALNVQKASVFKGLDNVMKIAAANGIAVQIVLFDHTFAGEAAGLLDPKDTGKQTSPEKKQGHLQALANPDNRELLLKNVIEPVLKHLSGKTNLLAVELVNEPESIIEGMHGKKGASIPKAQTQSFKEYMRTVRDLVHDAGAQFTVGCLGIGYAKEWLDVIDPHRDFISVHYYENRHNLDPKYGSLYGADSELMKLHKAGVTVVFGEYAGSGYGKVGTEAFLKDAHAHGIVQGALGAWSMYDGNGKPGAANFLVPLNDLRHFRLLNPFTWQRGASLPSDGLNRAGKQVPAHGVPSHEKPEPGKEKKSEIKGKAHKPLTKGRKDFGL